MFKRIRHILNIIVWTIIGSYLVMSALLHIPVIQQKVGEYTAEILEDKFGTKVKVGSVDLGFLNRLIIDDFEFYDKAGKKMVKASRLSVSIDKIKSVQGKIEISSAQIFGLKAMLYKATANAQPNYQFVIDSLASKDTTSSKLDLRINSFIIRNGEIKYDKLYKAYTPNKLNIDHIGISKISSSISLQRLTNDSFAAIVKRLSFTDNSGLEIRNLTFNLAVDKSKAELNCFKLLLPKSEIDSKAIYVNYTLKGNNIVPESIKSSGCINSKINLGDLHLADSKISSYLPSFGIGLEYSLENGKLNVSKMSVESLDKGIKMYATGQMYPFSKDKNWKIKLKDLSVSERGLSNIHRLLSVLNISIPEQANSIKKIHVSASAYGNANSIACNSKLATNIGDIESYIKKEGENLAARITAKEINIGQALKNEELGKLSMTVTANGKLEDKKIKEINTSGRIDKLQFKKYTYTNSNFHLTYNGRDVVGNMSISDPNIMVSINGGIKDIARTFATNITAQINKVNPQKLHLSDKWGNAVFSAQIAVNTEGKKPNDIRGKVNVKDLAFSSPKDQYSINRIEAAISPNYILVNSDFGKIELNGKYNLLTLDESLLGALKTKIPTMPGLERKIYSSNNRFTLKAEITESRWLNIFAGIPFNTNSPINIYTDINDIKRSVKAEIDIPNFSYNGDKYQNGKIHIDTRNDSIFAEANIKKLLKNHEGILLNAHANIANNKIDSKINIDYNTPTHIKGTVASQAMFYKDENGENTVMLHILPSSLMVKDTVWNIHPSDIIYNKSKIQFEDFAIGHAKQHVKIDGKATKSANDSICVDLADVDVNYILDLVNFHSVTFSGRATGQAYVKSVLNSPEAYANLKVKDFRFQDGDMGELHAKVNWNKEEKQIDIDALAKESDDAYTVIKGYVSPARNYIDLGITAHDTNIEFLKSFCGSFMSDIKAHANGFAQVYGDLSTVNMRGKLIADGRLKISTLNTEYCLKNDAINMYPNEIVFNGDTVTDRNGNIAVVTGALHHKNLTKLTFDLNIMADKFLCYDFNSYGTNSFYGTVYGTGNCAITGRSHRIDFDIDMTPNKGSFIEYNASDPNNITEQNFISWKEHKAESDSTEEEKGNAAALRINDASDLYLNFNVNTTPDFTLRVLMDKVSGDKISLNGSGTIKANYFNKGSFDMFGTYLIDHGSYNLTIQNIIKKDFQFQSGSSIIFGGNPFNANLNLKAVYPVNGVSLADLKIGNSFSSNNVRVDCIMNIGGTPESINVDFDFNLPTVNNDARQMIRSLINSEEDLNQQVVYLLAIGRFNINNKNNSTQEDAQQSQTSLAMQSLLSGTISQQVNSILSSLIKDNNWNFGTNISTGTEGFNNAEYEGLLSGRLFSNRLLINGQFGYRDNPNTTSSFIGDFDLKYLLTPSGSIAVKVYNQTNDRYFTKSSINTQGIGIILKRDFTNWLELFRKKKSKKK